MRNTTKAMILVVTAQLFGMSVGYVGSSVVAFFGSMALTTCAVTWIKDQQENSNVRRDV